MVQTRAATRRQQEAHLAQINQPTPLAPSSTIVQINPSATGQGVHTRWIRPESEGYEGNGHQDQDLNDLNNHNSVLMTPIREANVIPHSPPKLSRRPAVNLNNLNQIPRWPGEQNIAHVKPYGRDLANHLQSLEEHVQNANSSENHMLDSPFQDQQSSNIAVIPHPLLRQESTFDAQKWNNTFQHIPQTRIVTEQSQNSNDEVSLLLRKYRRGLGPHGTVIVDQHGNAIVPSLLNQ